MDDISKILFAADFSQGSERAFSMAISIARKYNARIDVVHVVQDILDMTAFDVPQVSFEALAKEIEEAAQKRMKEFCRDNIKGIEYVSHVKRGTPFKEIIETASAAGSDLIVIGTHGRSGIDHVLFGSTAEKVVRKSTIPVLTVRAQSPLSSG